MTVVRKLHATWTEVPISEVVEVNSRLFSLVPSAAELPVHFVPMNAVSEEYGGIDISRKRTLAEVQKGYTSFLAGDVLFAKITPCMENGKLAVVPELPEHIGFGSTEFHVLRCSTGVSPQWLAYYLSQSEFRRLARQNMTGSAGQMRVPTHWLANAQMPVAPLAEQSRVIAKLDELLSGLDSGVAELKAAQAKLTQYRQSLLKASVEGALTADWRAERARRGETTESGAQLLERILAERRKRWEAKQLARFKEQGKAPPKGWQDKYPEPVKPDVNNSPALPKGWVWATIDQLGDVGTGVTPLRSNSGYYDHGTIPWVTSGALNEDRVIAASAYVTKLALEECRLEIYPIGALLVAMYGEGKTRGKCSELLIAATINQAIAAIVLDEAAVSCKAFVKAFLHYSYNKMREAASGGVQPNLNLQIVKAITLPLAPLGEQEEIVEELGKAFELIEQQRGAIEVGLEKSKAQRKNILKSAFSGQLVPQDPNDEPASVLLERIRAERIALMGKKSQKPIKAKMKARP